MSLYRAQRRRIEKRSRRTRCAEERQRCQIVLGLGAGETVVQVHRNLGAARSTIYRVAERFSREGEAGLRDRRGETPLRKVTEEYMQRLEELIYTSPKEHGWRRSTWTAELLTIQLEQDTGLKMSRTHLSRLLRGLGMRWGRPRPGPLRYTSKAAKSRKVNALKRRLRGLSADEVVVYADEVDVHLNPKIGPCWMPRGIQFEVETPGKNQKRYVFGGLNAESGELVWLASDKKNSAVFIEWLARLHARYSDSRLIHVVCDNYIIHKSKKTRQAISRLGNIELHFLPPYSPEHNPIERLWGELHANVTRNHKHRSIDTLMNDVDAFLEAATPFPGSRPSLAAAA